MKLLNSSMIACAVFASLTACSGNGMTPTDQLNTTCATSPAMVTTAQLQAEVLTQKCTATCHEPGGTASAYGDYTTVDKAHEMVNKDSYLEGSGMTLKIVDAAAPVADRLANSSIWLKCSAKVNNGFKGPKMEFTSTRMPPPGKDVLADADVQKIKDWICTGANKM
ncbi:MAG: hypothetical protein JNK82_43905 [Myxococcaceae bacterium]|nr:hypothetical protein [Myxococcaceae bacterium]